MGARQKDNFPGKYLSQKRENYLVIQLTHDSNIRVQQHAADCV